MVYKRANDEIYQSAAGICIDRSVAVTLHRSREIPGAIILEQTKIEVECPSHRGRKIKIGFSGRRGERGGEKLKKIKNSGAGGIVKTVGAPR